MENTFINNHVIYLIACSFDSSCDVNNNCCFPGERSPTTTFASTTTVSTSECLYPMTSQISSTQRRFYSSYWMVNDVKSTANYNRISKQVTKKCGDVKVAPWGSFSPVHSKTTGKIYTNIACAEADNATDTVLWDLIINCIKSKTTIQAMSIYTSDSNFASTPEDCRFHFKYPGNADLKSERCFTNLISTCKTEQFTVPKHLNLTMTQIRQACTSGLVSPYRVKDLFQNVYCYICNGHYYSETKECKYSFDGKELDRSLMSMLIDTTLMSGNFRAEKTKKIVSLACPKQVTVDKVSK